MSDVSDSLPVDGQQEEQRPVVPAVAIDPHEQITKLQERLKRARRNTRRHREARLRALNEEQRWALRVTALNLRIVLLQSSRRRLREEQQTLYAQIEELQKKVDLLEVSVQVLRDNQVVPPPISNGLPSSSGPADSAAAPEGTTS